MVVSMSSYASIEFDFAKACQQAEQLEALAGKLLNLSNDKFQGTMQQLSLNWKGESAAAYQKKGAVLQNSMALTAKDVNKVAANIRTVARNIYEAEMEAKRIAEQREYEMNQNKNANKKK
jgi:uncharacterized protein YukE